MGELEIRKEISEMYYPTGEEENEDGQQMQDGDSSGGQTEGQEQEREERRQEEVDQLAPDVDATDGGETDQERFARLLEDYNRQSQRLLELESQLGRPAPAAPPLQVTETPAAPPTVGPSFDISEAELERALIEDDPKAMKKVLSGLIDYVGQVQRFQEQAIRESVLRDVPALANQIATEQVRLQLAIGEFYKENKDLVQYRGVVGSVMNEIVAKEPSLTLAEAFDKTEKETRRRLGLKKQTLDASGDVRRPAFAKPSGSRKPGAPALGGLKSEIADMIKAR